MTAPRTDTRVALVGCGLWGRNILRDLLSLGCEVSAVEPDPENRRLAKAVGPITLVADWTDLPKVDGVIIATPATSHASVVAEVSNLGIPIFCEKPLTTDLAEAGELAERYADRLFVMHVWRYHRGIQKLAKIAQSRELGAPLSLRTERMNWTSPRQDTDSIWTMVPHDLSIALAVLGELPRPRSAAVERIDGKPVSIVALLGDSPWFLLNSSNRYGGKHREIRLHCEAGVAVLPDPDAAHLEILRSTPAPDREPMIELRQLIGEPALLAELRTFVNYLRGGPPPPTDAREGLAVVKAVAELRKLAGV